jgi:hypothetical protein
MIIFELDSVLADIEHRRHFVDPNYFINTFKDSDNFYDKEWLQRKLIGWEPNYQAFYEACEKDEKITLHTQYT